MVDKKDVLEFPLEKLEVPQAIRLMMSAANRVVIEDAVEGEGNERLNKLCEKLEAYVEDAVEAAKDAPDTSETEEEEEMYPAASEEDVYLNVELGEVMQVIHKGVVFGRFCNEPVHFDHDTGITTTCIKQWAHLNVEHEDSEGRFRL